MFLRLFIAFLSFGVFASVLVAAVVLQRVEGGWYPAVFTEALPVVLVVGLIAVPPAWFFARNFVRPFRDIRAGADRIADGDYGQRVHGGVWHESHELANSFNEMSQQLASQFQRLESERHQLRTILGGMVEGVVAVGPGQRVLFANEAAGRMLEMDAAAGFGRPLWEMTRQPAVQTLLEQVLRDGGQRRVEMEFKGPAARHLTVYAAPLKENGSRGAVLVLHDTSELRRLERLRQDFVANVSHELKTPLAVIKACIETLQDGAVEDPEVRGPFLVQIAEQADRLHALILDLISLARIQSGAEAMEYQAVAVDEAVVNCLDRHRPRAEAKRLIVETVRPGAELTVWADEEAVGQILDNLVDNAVKYTPDGGTIRVAWWPAGNGVSLSVTDTGPGIPERDLPRIFERFYRVDKARSRELGGTGLGLSIVKNLAQTMKGTVKAVSELGQGTAFTVWLPRPADS